MSTAADKAESSLLNIDNAARGHVETGFDDTVARTGLFQRSDRIVERAIEPVWFKDRGVV